MDIIICSAAKGTAKELSFPNIYWLHMCAWSSNWKCNKKCTKDTSRLSSLQLGAYEHMQSSNMAGDLKGIYTHFYVLDKGKLETL